MKKIIALLLLILAIYSGYCLYTKKSSQKIYSTQEAIDIMDDVYGKRSGFGISNDERKMIEDKGGNPTYGEITAKGVEQLIEYFKANLGIHDVFYDLGSGIGKVATQVALTTPAKAVGIELSPTRHAIAHDIRHELIRKNILKHDNKLRFIEGNILDADLHDASVIFMCSTCFSDELMKQITEKIYNLPQVVHLITLKQLTPENTYHFDGFFQMQTFNIPMTWSESTPVYTYERL